MRIYDFVKMVLNCYNLLLIFKKKTKTRRKTKEVLSDTNISKLKRQVYSWSWFWQQITTFILVIKPGHFHLYEWWFIGLSSKGWRWLLPSVIKDPNFHLITVPPYPPWPWSKEVLPSKAIALSIPFFSVSVLPPNLQENLNSSDIGSKNKTIIR